jgi:hypothetical protein
MGRQFRMRAAERGSEEVRCYGDQGSIQEQSITCGRDRAACFPGCLLRIGLFNRIVSTLTPASATTYYKLQDSDNNKFNRREESSQEVGAKMHGRPRLCYGSPRSWGSRIAHLPDACAHQ